MTAIILLPRATPRVAYLGPPGTFTEEALLGQPALADAEPVAMKSMPEVLAATAEGDVDLGFVALENSIEGSVLLVFASQLYDPEDYIRDYAQFLALKQGS